MNKNEFCKEHDPVAYYWNGYFGITIYGIEYGIDDYVYFKTPEDGKAHKAKVYYTRKDPYFIYDGMTIKLCNFMNV